MVGEAVRVALPSSLDEGPGTWRDYHPAILASYCDDQEIKRWTYKHENLEFAKNPYVPGDQVIKTSHSDSNMAVVVVIQDSSDDMAVALLDDYDTIDVSPVTLADYWRRTISHATRMSTPISRWVINNEFPQIPSSLSHYLTG